MLQVCGIQSQTPYHIDAINVDVYSLEEINYFVYHHMNMVYREFFSEELFSYIEESLNQPDMAQRMREMDADGATVRDFVSYLLKESYYYSANDLSAVSGLILNIDNMSRAERLVLEADNFFKAGRYESALSVYLDVLKNMSGEPVNEAFYARVAFSVGVIFARLFMPKNANAYFNMAHEIYPDATYARACVYVALISGDDEELLATIRKYRISDETLMEIRTKVSTLKREIETGKESIDFIFNFENGRAASTISGWKDEYVTMRS